MKDVLPDLSKGYTDKLDSKDQQKLMKMSDEERRDEIMQRLGSVLRDVVAFYSVTKVLQLWLRSMGG